MIPAVRGRQIVQLGYVCGDPRGAAARWTQMMGAGPFYWFEMFRFADWSFEGRPVDTPVDLAMGFCGDINVEFICPRAPHRTVYGSAEIAPEPVLHHVAILSNDWQRDAEAFADLPLLASACTDTGSRFCYRDARTTLGTFLEIIEGGEDVTALFGAMHKASLEWDGKSIFATL